MRSLWFEQSQVELSIVKESSHAQSLHDMSFKVRIYFQFQKWIHLLITRIKAFIAFFIAIKTVTIDGDFTASNFEKLLNTCYKYVLNMCAYNLKVQT